MKKLIAVTALILFTGITFGQTLQKGNLVGMHVLTINLDPDVTFNQYKDYLINKFIPAVEKQFQGDIKLYLGEGNRGDDANNVSIMWIFKSIEVRDKYFAQADTSTEIWSSNWEKLLPIREGLNNLGAQSRKHYTDWVIQ